MGRGGLGQFPGVVVPGIAGRAAAAHADGYKPEDVIIKEFAPIAKMYMTKFSKLGKEIQAKIKMDMGAEK